ncbi:MAG: hypothetical protein AMJ59_14350 [Gammaproteobacteria bacterium SG8_31]|nr:MAG: hypothetical protein AMJ59_14350 [Gammaproteobacteria bacterium SG8_31]
MGGLSAAGPATGSGTGLPSPSPFPPTLTAPRSTTGREALPASSVGLTDRQEGYSWVLSRLTRPWASIISSPAASAARKASIACDVSLGRVTPH